MTFAWSPEGDDQGANCETTIGKSILGMRTGKAEALRQTSFVVLKEQGRKYDWGGVIQGERRWECGGVTFWFVVQVSELDLLTS